MLIPIVCNCGRPLADIADKFEELKNKMISEEIKDLPPNVDPHNKIYMEKNGNVSLEKIFKDLKVTAICCRVQLSTNMQFSDYY